MKRTSALLIAVLFSAAAFAQMEMPKPGPEHKKLEYFTGHWNCEGDMKPGPMGPGGKMTMNEHSDWMEGGYFVVVHSTFMSVSMGNGTGISVMGYDPDEKKYTYNEFNSTGEAVHSKGVVDGDTWTWTSDMKMGPQTMKGRFREKILSPTSYTFQFETSSDGTSWSQVMAGKCTKNK